MKTSSLRQVIVALTIAVSAATVHGAWFASTDAHVAAPVITISTWDYYEKSWTSATHDLANYTVDNPLTVRHSEDTIVAISGSAVTLPVGLNADELESTDLATREIPEIPGATHLHLRVSTPANLVGSWPVIGSGPVDPDDTDLAALDVDGSVGLHTVAVDGGGTFTWDIGRWSKGDIFLGLNNHTYKVLDRNGNFKRFVASADYDQNYPDEIYNVTTGCATNWKTGEVYATNFGDYRPAVNILGRHPQADYVGDLSLYSSPSRRISTRIDRTDDAATVYANPYTTINYGIDTSPESVVFDADMNMYVGHSFGNFRQAPADWQGEPDKIFEFDDEWTEYTIAVDGLPLEGWSWADGWGWVVDETGVRMLLAPAGTTDPDAFTGKTYGVEVSARLSYNTDGTLKTATASQFYPAIAGLDGWDPNAQLPESFISDPATGAALVRPGTGDALVPSRWSLGKRLHKYIVQDGAYESTPAARDEFWTFSGRQGTDWIDLDVTGEVMYYTSEDSFIHRYRVKPGANGELVGQMPDVGVGLEINGQPTFGKLALASNATEGMNGGVLGDYRFHGLRILPPGDGTGGFLVAVENGLGVHRFTAEGKWVQRYYAHVDRDRNPLTGNDGREHLAAAWYTLEVDPGGKSFWASAHDSGWVAQFDIASGRVLNLIEAVEFVPLNTPGMPEGRRVEGICIMWEYTAPQEICFTPDGDPQGLDDDGDGYVDENCKAIEICSAVSPGDDDGDDLPDQYDSDCSPELPPVATDDAYALNQQDPAQPTLSVDAASGVIKLGPVADYDRDSGTYADVSALTVASFGANESSLTLAPGATLTTPDVGAVVLQADGSFVFTPDPDFHGVFTFAYRITDGYPEIGEPRDVPTDGSDDVATVTITVAPKVANDGTFSLWVGEVLSMGGLLANDPAQSSAQHPITITEAGASGSPVAFSGSRTFQTGHMNTVTVNADGSFSFSASNLAYGGPDYFTYAVHNTVSRSWNIATVTFEVRRPVITVVVPDQIKTYDGAPLSTTCTVTSERVADPAYTMTYTGTIRGGAAYGPTTTAPTASGNYTATCVHTDPALGPQSDTGSIVITPVPLVVTAADTTRPYLAANPAVTRTITGFVNGETESVLGGTTTCATSTPQSANVGTYADVNTCSQTLSATNYTFSYVPGDLTVTGFVLTVTASDTEKLYGDPNPAVTYSITGFQGTDTAGTVVNGTTACSTTGGPDAGTYTGANSCTPTLTATNYTFVYEPGTLRIDPRPLVVTAEDKTKDYDGTAYAPFTVTYSGFVDGDDAGDLGGALAFSGAATTAVNAGTYTDDIVPAGYSSTNYTITYEPGTLTITPVPLTITALNRSKVYGDVVAFTTPQVTTDFTVAGLVNGEVITTATLSSTGSPATATVAGSTYPIAISSAVTTADLNNYVVTYVAGELTVTPRPLTITAHDKTKVVDEPVPTLDGVWAGFVNGDTADAVYTTTAIQSSPAGLYPITPQPDTSNPVLGNYALTIVPGTLTVTPKSIDVVAQPVCIADTPYVNFTITAQNFTPVVGEDITLRWKDSTGAVVLTQTFIWTNVSAPFTQQVLWPGAVVDGNGTVVDWPGWIFTGTEWVPGNDGFQLTRPTSTVEIEVNPTTALQVSYPPATPMCEAAPPRTPTIAATGGVYPYDGQPHAATCSVTGAGGESLPGVLTYDDFGADPPVNAGTYPATCTFAGNADYVPMTATTTVTVTPIPLVITADDKSKTYDGQVFPGPYTVTYSGFVSDDDAGDLGGALTFTGAAQTAVSAGTYTDGIVPGGYSSTNYTISYVPGTLRIDPPELIVTAQDKTKVYDGAAYSPFTVTYSGFVGDDDPGDLGGALTFTGAAVTAVNAGTYTEGIVPGGYTSSNYTIRYVPGTLTITPVPLVVAADDKSKPYDGAVYSPFTVTYSGFVAGDDAGDLGGALTFGGAAATAVNVGTSTDGIVPAGYTSTNYTIDYEPGTLTITPIPAVVTANDKTIYAGDPLPTFDGVWTGLLAGQTATATYATTAADSSVAGTFPITPTPANTPVLANYIVETVPGTLTILPRVAPCSATGYVTYSQGGWGSRPRGGNPGALLAANFSTVYPGGSAQIGGTFKLTFTSASAIAAYLPAGGSAKVLTSSQSNPTSSKGVLSAQLLALQLAADFSRAGVLQTGLGSMVMQSGPLAGQSVDGILAMANDVFGGNTGALPSGMSLSALSSLLESIIMNYHEGADAGNLACPGGPVTPPVCTVVPPSPGVALVRRDTTFDGRLEGSIQLMQAVNVTLNSTAVVTGQLRLPGVPQKTFNGGTSVTIENGGGSVTPTWHRFMFNSGASLGSLVERTDGIDLPSVAAPPASSGTRTVTLNTPSGAIDDFATLKDLTLNSNVGPIAVPEGTYGTFIANNNTAFVLGVAGATEPAIYNFQTLTLNSGSRLDIVGPVVITVKNSISANGPINPSQNPGRLTFRVSNGDFTLNSGVPFYGYVEAPNGRVTVNNGAKLVGGLVADTLTNNSGGLVQLVGSPGETCEEDPEPLALVLKIDDKVKMYGDPDPGLTYQITAGGPVESGVLSGMITRVSGEPVGEYEIGAGTLTASSDYALTVIPGTLTVLPRPADVTAGTGTKVYGTADPALTAVTTAGFLAADLASITLDQSRQAGEAVGTYVTTPTASGAVLSNYTVTYITSEFTITPAPEPVCEVNNVLSMNESSSSTGPYGNERTFTQGGVTVKVAAFSRYKSSNNWAKGYVGAFGTAGLGVTDSGENGGGTTHTVDNNGRNNYLVFVFSEPVAVTRAYLGYVSGDSDAQFWVGTLPDAFSDVPMFSDAVLASLGSGQTSSGGSSARWATFNSNRLMGNVLVVAASTNQSNDYFKVAKLDFDSCSTPTPPPPPPGPTESSVCSGGVTKLVLKYIGSGSPNGTVRGQRSAPGTGPVVNAQVSGTSTTLYTFAIEEMGGLFDSVSGGRLANNFTVFIGNTEIADVHTSCSVPIYPGMKVGSLFEIVEVWTKGGGKMTI